MAKNISNFAPGLQQATADLTYKTIILTSPYGQDMDGTATSDYGETHTFFDPDKSVFCNNVRMKKGELCTGGTGWFMFGGSGPSGGSCCCQQSSPGRSGGGTKWSPRWTHDSDHVFVCLRTGCGCCVPQCNGQCSYQINSCHTSGGHGGTVKMCISKPGGCGAASVCCYHYCNCCNYGAIGSSGAAFDPSNRGCAESNCYTTCQEEPLASCDTGYDCIYCQAPGNFGFEGGSCIDRCAGQMCGRPMFSNYPNWKKSAFRNGTVMMNLSQPCELAQGGFMFRCTWGCDFGMFGNMSNYYLQGQQLPAANSCGSPCCCGAPAVGSGMHVIRFDEEPK